MIDNFLLSKAAQMLQLFLFREDSLTLIYEIIDMAKKFLFALACLYFFSANADAPGKVAIADSKITFKNLAKQSDHIFYWKGEYDAAKVFTADSTFIIPGSGGKPMNAMVWGIDKKTNASTDTIFFSNFYAPDFIITIDTVSNNKLLYSQEQKPNSNNGNYYGNSNDSSVNTKSPGHTNIILFSVISLIALILLIWFFIRRKNKIIE